MNNMGNIESNLFESYMRIRNTSEGYEAIVKIESVVPGRNIWVEKKKLFAEFPSSFDDLMNEAKNEFASKIAE